MLIICYQEGTWSNLKDGISTFLLGYWIGIMPAEKSTDLELMRYPDFKIGELLLALPLVEMRDEPGGVMLINSLLQGDPTKATLDINGRLIPVFLMANPAKHKIDLLGETGELLPASILQPKVNVKAKKSLKGMPLEKTGGNPSEGIKEQTNENVNRRTMIREKDKNKLIDYLQSLDLLGPGAAPQLKKDDAWIMDCTSRWAAEHGLVSARVVIEQGSQKDFTVEDYRIKYLKTPSVQHIVSMGTDTRELEERLSAINWQKDDHLIIEDGSDVNNAVKDVLRLRLFGDQNAKDVADMLIIKYWMQTPAIAVVPPGISFSKYATELRIALNGDSTDINAQQAVRLLEGRAVKRFQDPDRSTDLKGEWLAVETEN